MQKFRIAVFLAVGSAVSGNVTAGLIASWSGDGNANDSVNSAHNGTLVNGAGFSSGQIGQAFRLDGSSDFISVPDNNAWAFGTGDFSISLWASFDSVRHDTYRRLPNVFIGHSPGAGTQGKWVFFYDDDGYLMFLNGPNSTLGVDFLRSPRTFFPTLGEWYNFTVTRSGGSYTFYVDGVSLGTATSTVPTPNVTGRLTIGQAEGLGYFDGRLDEIQIYNNALSPTEVAGLASAPKRPVSRE